MNEDFDKILATRDPIVQEFLISHLISQYSLALISEQIKIPEYALLVLHIFNHPLPIEIDEIVFLIVNLSQPQLYQKLGALVGDFLAKEAQHYQTISVVLNSIAPDGAIRILYKILLKAPMLRAMVLEDRLYDLFEKHLAQLNSSQSQSEFDLISNTTFVYLKTFAVYFQFSHAQPLRTTALFQLLATDVFSTATALVFDNVLQLFDVRSATSEQFFLCQEIYKEFINQCLQLDTTRVNKTQTFLNIMRVLQKALEKGSKFASQEILKDIKEQLVGFTGYLVEQCETELLNEVDIDAFVTFCEINFEANFEYDEAELHQIIRLSTSLMNADLYYSILKFPGQLDSDTQNQFATIKNQILTAIQFIALRHTACSQVVDVLFNEYLNLANQGSANGLNLLKNTFQIVAKMIQNSNEDDNNIMKIIFSENIIESSVDIVDAYLSHLVTILKQVQETKTLFQEVLRYICILLQKFCNEPIIVMKALQVIQHVIKSELNLKRVFKSETLEEEIEIEKVQSLISFLEQLETDQNNKLTAYTICFKLCRFAQQQNKEVQLNYQPLDIVIEQLQHVPIINSLAITNDFDDKIQQLLEIRQIIVQIEKIIFIFNDEVDYEAVKRKSLIAQYLSNLFSTLLISLPHHNWFSDLLLESQEIVDDKSCRISKLTSQLFNSSFRILSSLKCNQFLIEQTIKLGVSPSYLMEFLRCALSMKPLLQFESFQTLLNLIIYHIKEYRYDPSYFKCFRIANEAAEAIYDSYKADLVQYIIKIVGAMMSSQLVKECLIVNVLSHCVENNSNAVFIVQCLDGEYSGYVELFKVLLHERQLNQYEQTHDFLATVITHCHVMGQMDVITEILGPLPERLQQLFGDAVEQENHHAIKASIRAYIMCANQTMAE